MLALAIAGLGLLAAAPATADARAEHPPRPRVTIAMVPSGTTVEQIETAVPGIAPGVLSAGIGRVPASQTYLDIGQGTRLAGSLYPDTVPPLYVTGNRVAGRRWQQTLERAEDAPANIDPGLLASTLEDAGVSITATPLAGSPALIAVDEEGRVLRGADCRLGDCPGVTVGSVRLSELGPIAERRREQRGDVLIVLERAPPDRDLLAIGIAGPGFTAAGNLTSASTRMGGYVLSTDLLPTILDAYGIAIPDDVTGRVIETEGDADAEAVASREERLGEITERRTGALATNVLIWVALLALVAIVLGRRGAAFALRVFAIAMAAVPALLLIPAAIEPSALVERLLVGVGAPLVALLAIALTRPLGHRGPYAAFALAAGLSVGAIAIDVLAGSQLTPLSLLGSNPGYGVRFFGIGNELEATIGVLLLLGTGAAVTAIAPRDPRRAMAIATVLATLAAVLVFAPGRFGADVGAAITFPAGAAAAVIAALGLGGRRAMLVVLAPVAALALLVAVDLVLGGDAHLSRSVLDAGGLDEVGDVFERRISLGAKSFPNYIDSPFFIAALVGIVAAVWQRRRIASWLEGAPAARAGVIGAAGATVIGTLANDSAALLLMVGTAFIAAFCGLAWGARPPAEDRPPR